MASQFRTYVSKAKVKARKVSTEGETVVTSAGPVSARKGDYVIDRLGTVTVVDGDTFKQHWAPKPPKAPKPVPSSDGDNGGTATVATPRPTGPSSTAPRTGSVAGTSPAAGDGQSSGRA